MGVKIENLYFSYNDKSVFNNIDLEINTGESIGIAGVSGGGKSTLLKLISGLYDVQHGKILVMDAQSSTGRRKNVSMVMQSSSLFPASIRDNISCGHLMSDDVIYNACEAAQLIQWIDSLQDGINTFVGERGGQVSGGQGQRIAIARAIAKNAPVVLLDEPTSALDVETSTAVIKALEELTKGKTVIHVSHKPETLRGCDRILLLEGGCLCVS